MEELFLETSTGNIPIDHDMIKRHNLHKGTMSPFTGYRIVGANGDFHLDIPIESESPLESLHHRDDGLDEMENGLALSTSEILDIAEGADNSME